MRGRPWRGVSALLLALAAAAATAIGCGGEREFDAASVTEQLNRAGAGLALGEPLSSAEGGPEVVSVEVGAGEEKNEAGHGHGHSDGAIVVLDGTEAAEQEFSRCQAAVDFTCYRAANVVLRFTGMSPVDQQAMAEAVKALASG